MPISFIVLRYWPNVFGTCNSFSHKNLMTGSKVARLASNNLNFLHYFFSSS